MRVSLGLFNTAVKTEISYFNTLPEKLQRFFTRYPPRPFKEYASESTLTTAENANPFIANKHPITKRYHTAKYSMRRQSDLWKIAYRHGIQDSLPPLANGKKFYQEKYDTKPLMKGVLRPKGAKYERERPLKEAKMKEALLHADEKIAELRGKVRINFYLKFFDFITNNNFHRKKLKTVLQRKLRRLNTLFDSVHDDLFSLYIFKWGMTYKKNENKNVEYSKTQLFCRNNNNRATSN